MPLHACTLCDAGRTHVQWWPSACARRQSPGLSCHLKSRRAISQRRLQGQENDRKNQKRGTYGPTRRGGLCSVCFFLSLSVWTGPGLNTQKASTKKKVTHARISLSTR